MKLKQIHLKNFKRFHELKINDIPRTAKLIVLTGPNGSGKTSLFDAFNFWMRCKKERYGVDSEYYSRDRDTSDRWSQLLERIVLEFYDYEPANVGDRAGDNRKEFYIRSAFRHEADFTIRSLEKSENILINSGAPETLKEPEKRVSDNYQRIVASAVNALFNDEDAQQQSGLEIRDALIGQIRKAMRKVFPDLILDGPGNPLEDGAFRFTKNDAAGFHYKNLSGGEKAAFDLLLDFIVKREAFDDTVFCIDEPELHMHTRLQAKLLEVIYGLIPDNCQLWLSTHSIGMARKAAELNSISPGKVVFIDFHDQNFDQSVELTPANPDRQFWKRMFSTALDDLSTLIVPKYVVFCEGRKIGQQGRSPSFDANIYKTIFGAKYPDIEFVPLGGGHEVQHDGKAFDYLLTQLAPGIKTWKIFDKDDRNEVEIAELEKESIYVLSRRDIESFLWDDEVLQKLCERHQSPESFSQIQSKKKSQLQTLPSRGKPVDDIKAIADSLYSECKRILKLTGCGNTAEAFSLEHLAPLIEPGMAVYDELAATILAPLRT